MSGKGRCIGVVGRMGSGKSYMAVRMAYKRLRAGDDVWSNFSMHLAHSDACARDDRGELVCRKPVPKVAGKVHRFTGWDEFAEIDNAVVIVDEAHLLAPSSQHLHFPNVARWKLSQSRKFGLDVYWVSQHEDRVNRTLRDLTNLIYVCHSYFDGLWFTARGYEPENLRKKDRKGKNLHIDWQFYSFRRKIAQLYDTLEVLDADEHLRGDDMSRAREIAAGWNLRRTGGALSGSEAPDPPNGWAS